MAKKELVKIESFQGEEKNSQIFVMTMDTSGMSIYEKAKATQRFLNTETKVLEQILETLARNVLRENGIIVRDGGNQALEHALWELEQRGKTIAFYDRYKDIENENIIGESPNFMTVIEEDNKISCAMEMVVYERDGSTT